MAERLLLVRHGQTEWSETHRHTGHTDVPLTGLGRDQAGELRKMLDRFEPFSIISSPLSRARDTAKLAGYSDVAIDPDLMEWDYGTYEGQRTVDTREEIPGWSVWTHEIIGGESIDELGERCDRVLKRVDSMTGTVALFGHGHALRVLTARWVGEDPRFGSHLILDTAAISVLGFERENRALLHWNEVCHLRS